MCCRIAVRRCWERERGLLDIWDMRRRERRRARRGPLLYVTLQPWWSYARCGYEGRKCAGVASPDPELRQTTVTFPGFFRDYDIPSFAYLHVLIIAYLSIIIFTIGLSLFWCIYGSNQTLWFNICSPLKVLVIKLLRKKPKRPTVIKSLSCTHLLMR